MASDSQTDWLNRQLLPDQKKRIQLAAHLRGMSITEFGVTALDEAAIQVIEQHEAEAREVSGNVLFLHPLDPHAPVPAIHPESLNEMSGRFVIASLSPGFSAALQPVLWAMINEVNESIETPAVTGFRIAGSTMPPARIPGVAETALEIGNRLGRISFRMKDTKPRTLSLIFQGPGIVTAAGLQNDQDVEVLDRDVEICTISEQTTLHLDLRMRWGHGIVPEAQNREADLGAEFIYLNSRHCPLRSVRFKSGSAGGSERLTIGIETNGSASPAKVLGTSLDVIRDNVTNPDRRRKNLALQLDDLGSFYASVRTWNCLRNANITTVRELVQKNEDDIVRIHGSGRKVLAQIKGMLAPLGLSLGMILDEDGYPQPGPTSALSSAVLVPTMLRLPY